jgi:hypothetical protein
MGVFLRWGVFGILAVAATLYAYNASKRLAERRPPPAPVVASPEAGEEEPGEEESAEAMASEEAEPVEALPAACEEERQVAERALKMRRDGEPIDRVLRIQIIVFQSDEMRRARLEAVARQWFDREGADPNAAALREQVLRDCRRATPAS